MRRLHASTAVFLLLFAHRLHGGTAGRILWCDYVSAKGCNTAVLLVAVLVCEASARCSPTLTKSSLPSLFRLLPLSLKFHF